MLFHSILPLYRVSVVFKMPSNSAPTSPPHDMHTLSSDAAAPPIFTTLTAAQQQPSTPIALSPSTALQVLSPMTGMTGTPTAASLATRQQQPQSTRSIQSNGYDTEISDDTMSESNASRCSANSEITFQSSSLSKSDTPLSSMIDQPFANLLYQSQKNPKVLIGWRVLVRGSGIGVVLDLKRKKFSTTRFVIQFENGLSKALKLQRSEKKGKVPFTLLNKVS
jgi:hypothetical protein